MTAAPWTWSVAEIAEARATRGVRASEVAAAFLERSHAVDPLLRCYVTIDDDGAQRAAQRVDAEGPARGPLHGVPYAFKDVFVRPDALPTVGVRRIPIALRGSRSTVLERLERAGSVPLGSLSLDPFGYAATGANAELGHTRNPWDPARIAGGSSSGAAAAVAAGCVPFAIGSDTGGSVIQPAERNGVAGLRPTFGRVSRYGGMTLAWTQDTVGPLCRSAEDCALVFDAIYGPDGKDNTVLDVPFRWDANAGVRQLRVGYLRSAFAERAAETPAQVATRRNNQAALEVIRAMGVTVVPFDLPDVRLPAIDFIRWAETAAAFDEPTRRGTLRDIENGPEASTRPADIRTGRFITAVDYIQANRYRMRVMEQMDAAMANLDLFLGANAALTNRLGYPILCVPSGFFEGSPTGLHLTGKLFGEPEVLLLAHAFQARTDHHLKHPSL